MKRLYFLVLFQISRKVEHVGQRVPYTHIRLRTVLDLTTSRIGVVYVLQLVKQYWYIIKVHGFIKVILLLYILWILTNA